MGFIPENAKWYLADIVQEITVEGDPRNVVHTNCVLIHADSPEEAYEKALVLGKESETSYENIDRKSVTFRFRGLRDLNVIHDELKHGCELSYSEEIGMSEAEIEKWISSKEELGVFAPIRPSRGPDYGDGAITKDLIKEYPNLDPRLDGEDGQT